MKLVPPFKEQLSADYKSDFRNLSDNMNAISDSDVDIIVNYLNSCVMVDEWLSAIPDPINKSVKIPNRSWTDGTYYWDEMLIHFVRHYKARLPRDFIAHIKREHLKPHPDIDIEKVKVEIRKSFRAARQRDMSTYDMS